MTARDRPGCVRGGRLLGDGGPVLEGRLGLQTGGFGAEGGSFLQPQSFVVGTRPGRRRGDAILQFFSTGSEFGGRFHGHALLPLSVVEKTVGQEVAASISQQQRLPQGLLGTRSAQPLHTTTVTVTGADSCRPCRRCYRRRGCCGKRHRWRAWRAQRPVPSLSCHGGCPSSRWHGRRRTPHRRCRSVRGRLCGNCARRDHLAQGQGKFTAWNAVYSWVRRQVSRLAAARRRFQGATLPCLADVLYRPVGSLSDLHIVSEPAAATRVGADRRPEGGVPVPAALEGGEAAAICCCRPLRGQRHLCRVVQAHGCRRGRERSVRVRGIG